MCGEIVEETSVFKKKSQTTLKRVYHGIIVCITTES